MRLTTASLPALALATMFCVACSSESSGPVQSDVAQDLAGDATVDTGPDTTVDVQIDTAEDSLQEIAPTDLNDAEPDVTPPPTNAAIQAGDYSLLVNTQERTVQVQNKGVTVFGLRLDKMAAGTVDEPDDGTSYDPHPWLVTAPLYKAPKGLQFIEPTGETIIETDDTSIFIRFDYPAHNDQGQPFQATLKAELSAEGRFKLHWVPSQSAPWVIFRIAGAIDHSEGLYGLGEYFDQVNHRGMIRAMQLEADGALESAYNEAHVPIPFVTGTNAWGLFVENPYPAAFDFSGDDPSLFYAYFGTGLASTQGLTFHIFVADHPLDVTNHYYKVTGYPKLPARWALGPWVWRDENEDQAEVENDINTMRDLDLAATGYWIDRPYATAVNTFDFKASQFPDADAMIAMIHALGFRTALWHTPYLDEKDDATLDLRTHAEENSFYPSKFGLILNKWGKPIDLTNPEAFTWWQSLIKLYTDRGIEGFKLDYGEDVVIGISSKRINIWNFFNGEDERTMHKFFTLYYHRAYAEMLPEEGGFLLCRHGAYGDQVNGPIIWPGDLDADMSRHREVITTDDGDTYGAVGGLPAAVIASQTLGPSGFPFFGSDTGGYRHSPPDEETFIRWFQHTALSVVMQIGTSSNDVAWEFFNDQNDPDGQKLDLYRTLTRLHLRLFPYLWTYSNNLLVDGRPILRSLGLARPEMGIHPDDEYFLGDHLFVAPVINKGQIKRTVHFPQGNWIDWWSGEIIPGGAPLEVDAPLEKLPLYLAQGGIVPMLRPTIDTIAPTSQPDRVDSMHTDTGLLYVRTFPGDQTAHFDLYDGSSVQARWEQEQLILSFSDGSEFNQGAVFEVVGFGTDKPASVTTQGTTLVETNSFAELDEVAAGWYFAPETGGTLWVKAQGGSIELEVE